MASAILETTAAARSAHPDTAPDGNGGSGTALTVVHDSAAQGNPSGRTGLTLK